MLLIDTSVWISVFRDRSGEVRQQLETLIERRRAFSPSQHDLPDTLTLLQDDRAR